VLAFATRPKAPPSKETLGLLSGIIAGGPLIRQTRPANSIEVNLPHDYHIIPSPS
jgi:acylglycerol lipase